MSMSYVKPSRRKRLRRKATMVKRNSNVRVNGKSMVLVGSKKCVTVYGDKKHSIRSLNSERKRDIAMYLVAKSRLGESSESVSLEEAINQAGLIPKNILRRLPEVEFE